MSVDLSSLGTLSAVLPPDFNAMAGAKGGDDATRIKQVSKAMEMLFTSQLAAEMGKGMEGGTPDEASNGGTGEAGGAVYQDFIQQAMTQGMTAGHGLGLAKQIENYLTLREHPSAAPYMHPALKHGPNAL